MQVPSTHRASMRFPCCSRSVRSPGISQRSSLDAPAMGMHTLPHPLWVALSPLAAPSPVSFLPGTPPSSSSTGPGANQSAFGACKVWDGNFAAPTRVRREGAVGLDPLKPHESDLQGEGRDGEGGCLARSPANSQPYARSSPSCPQLPVHPASL